MKKRQERVRSFNEKIAIANYIRDKKLYKKIYNKAIDDVMYRCLSVDTGFTGAKSRVKIYDICKKLKK